MKRNQCLEILIKTLRDLYKKDEIPISSRDCSTIFTIFMHAVISSEQITEAMRMLELENENLQK
jgi:hypothetical protein